MGDYTTLLAGECGRRGHETCLLALNDPHIESANAGAFCLRLSSSLAWPVRVEKAKEFLSAFEPDFVSLQFVCYGFEPRGIDFKLAGRLRGIIGARPVHIMFHELWIGGEKGAPAKQKIAGMLQRHCVLRVIKALDTRVVHTSNAPYAAMLRAKKVSATVLPLFGSIPVPDKPLFPPEPGGPLVFGIFGSIHPVWPPEPLFSLLRKTGRKIEIVHIGAPGGGAALWEKLKSDYASAIEFRSLGMQPPERIAEFFQTEIDFGIATTPWELIGKSATVAAMLEHGLPVIVNRDDWHSGKAADAAPVSPLLVEMDETLPQKLSTLRRARPQARLPETATQFLNSLEGAA